VQLSSVAQDGGTVQSNQFTLIPCILQVAVLLQDAVKAAGHAAQVEARLKDDYVAKILTHELRSILDTNTFNVATVGLHPHVSLVAASTAKGGAGSGGERWWTADSASFLWLPAPAFNPGKPDVLASAKLLERNLKLLYIFGCPIIALVVSVFAVMTADKRSLEQYRCCLGCCGGADKQLYAIPDGTMESSSRSSSDLTDSTAGGDPRASPVQRSPTLLPSRSHKPNVVVPIDTLVDQNRPLSAFKI